jgi:hypothetical protein
MSRQALGERQSSRRPALAGNGVWQQDTGRSEVEGEIRDQKDRLRRGQIPHVSDRLLIKAEGKGPAARESDGA